MEIYAILRKLTESHTDLGDIAYYNYDLDCWIAEPSSAEIDPPVAWCEIPKYEE